MPDRVLILARRRQVPRTDEGQRTAARRGESYPETMNAFAAWVERNRARIEGFDDSFDNGAGAFYAIVEVETGADLERLLAEYPWRAWVDVETRPAPPISDRERQRWRELNASRDEAIEELRRSRGPDYRASTGRWRALLAEADRLDPRHPFVARLLASLRHDLGDLGQYGQAVPYARRLLDLHAGLVGPDDPALFINWIALASALHIGGDPAATGEAEACYRRALAIAERSGDPVKIRDGVHQLGQHLRNRGRLAEAEPHLRRLVALDGGDADAPDQAGRARPSALTTDLMELARLREDRGDLAEAEAVARRALALQEARADEGSAMMIALARHRVVDLCTRQGRLEEAVVLLRTALADAERPRPAGRSEGPNGPARLVDAGMLDTFERNQPMLKLAGLLDRLGRTEEAEQVYCALLDRVDPGSTRRGAEAEAPRPASQLGLSAFADVRPDALRGYAKLLRRTGRRSEATRLRRRASALDAASEAERPPRPGSIDR